MQILEMFEQNSQTLSFSVTHRCEKYFLAKSILFREIFYIDKYKSEFKTDFYRIYSRYLGVF